MRDEVRFRLVALLIAAKTLLFQAIDRRRPLLQAGAHLEARAFWLSTRALTQRSALVRTHAKKHALTSTTVTTVMTQWQENLL
jgi:hypothetical protein